MLETERYLASGELQAWLRQHYYEREADALEHGLKLLPEYIYNTLKEYRWVNVYRLKSTRLDYCGEFKTRNACEKGRKTCLETEYLKAEQYMMPGASGGAAEEAAEFYSELLMRHMKPFLTELKRISAENNTEDYFESVRDYISDSRWQIQTEFNEELEKKREYYQMYPFSYFLDKVEIKKHDYRSTEENLLMGIFETVVGNSVDYTFEGANDAILEMEEDLNDRIESFSVQAHDIFLESVRRLMKQILETLKYHKKEEESI